MEQTKRLEIEYFSTVSLDVDPQNGFTPNCPLELPVDGGNEIADECNANAKLANYRYLSKDAHPASGIWNATEKKPQFTKIEGENVDLRWNQHCVVGTPGFELIKGLPHPSEYDFIVYKGAERDMHPYSPIYHDLAKRISTGIIEMAKCDGINTFVLGGLALDYCLKEAALDLRKAGFRVIVNLAATRAIGKAEMAIDELMEKGVEFINNSKGVFSNKLPF